MRRRTFIQTAAALPTVLRGAGKFDLAAFERPRVLKAAAKYLGEAPVTVTAASSPRSAGGKHDFFSEGDYWWPDSNNPDGPYIQRDGMTNPDNFVEHRRAMVRLSLIVPALAAAYKLTRDKKYSAAAAREQTEYCRNRLKTVLIPNQMGADGSFPEELRRTKPYGYSLFNLDAMAILVQTITTPEDNLWKWQLPDGRGMARAMSYMYP